MRKLFFGGSILTMESPTPAEAILVEGDRILAVGDESVLRHMAGRQAAEIDLGGGALLPGFVDGGGDFLHAVRTAASERQHPWHPRAFRDAITRAAAQVAAQGVTCLHQLVTADNLPFLRRVLHIGLPMPLMLTADIRDYEAVKRAVAGVRGQVRLCGAAVMLESPTSGELALSDRALGHALHMAAAEEVQPVLYADSEAAIAQALRVMRAMSRPCPQLYAARTVLMGARELSPTQAEQLRELGMFPCFAADTLWHRGDALLPHLGIERTSRLLPMASVRRAGVPMTMCHDSTDGVPNPLALLYCATTRTTSGGLTLGAGERLPVYDALRALTLFGAWRYHGEWERGCIRAGMRADLVWLDRDPLSIPPAALSDLGVRATLCGGEVVCCKKERKISTLDARVPTVY